MNVYKAKTIKARATKFADNISYSCPQLKLVLKFNHAPLSLRKSKKQLIADVILKLESSILLEGILQSSTVDFNLLACFLGFAFVVFG